MPRGILLAFVSPSSADVEQEFNRWYDEVHVPDLLRAAGVVAARRYRISEAQMPFYAAAVAAFGHSYIALYEVEAEDPQKALLDLEVAARDFANSDAVDYGTLQAIYFDQVFPT